MNVGRTTCLIINEKEASKGSNVIRAIGKKIEEAKSDLFANCNDKYMRASRAWHCSAAPEALGRRGTAGGPEKPLHSRLLFSSSISWQWRATVASLWSLSSTAPCLCRMQRLQSSRLADWRQTPTAGARKSSRREVEAMARGMAVM